MTQNTKRYLIVPPAGSVLPLAADVAKMLIEQNPWPSLGVAREKTRAFRALFGVQLYIENVTASVKRIILS